MRTKLSLNVGVVPAALLNAYFDVPVLLLK
jgi:hypothetical protein